MKFSASPLMWMEPEDAAGGAGSRLDELYIRDLARGGFRCLRLVDVHLPTVDEDADDDDNEGLTTLQ